MISTFPWPPDRSPAAKRFIKRLFQNGRGLTHFAESAEQNVPVPFSETVLKQPSAAWRRPHRGQVAQSLCATFLFPE